MSDPSPRSLPAVGPMLDRPALRALVESMGRAAVVDAVREAIAGARKAILAGTIADPSPESLERSVIQAIAALPRGLRRTINATGILLHTGLGRAPLASEAIEAVASAASGYCDLEFDLATGERGRRSDGVASLLKTLTGAEAAAVANNNAAATILALRALAFGREVIVSRGELVEIGGSFRLPEIMAASGARLREVGTTNRTRLEDYERAIGPETAAVMRVHPSNYRIVGFTESVQIADLAALGRSRGLWTIDDIGSGAIGPGLPSFARDEPTISEGIAAGADLILFSGDKLLGGPQCGMIVGRSEAVAKVAADPLMRAMRVDKMTLAALEATLRLILAAPGRIPLWRLATVSADSLFERATRLAERISRESNLSCRAEPSEAYLGGGSVPAQSIPSASVRIGPPWPATSGSEAGFARSLRLGDPAVVPRVQSGAVILDLRAVEPEDDDRIASAVARVVAGTDL